MNMITNVKVVDEVLHEIYFRGEFLGYSSSFKNNKF